MTDVAAMTKDQLKEYAQANHGVSLDMTQRVASLREQVTALDKKRDALDKAVAADATNPDKSAEEKAAEAAAAASAIPPMLRNKTSGKIYPYHPMRDNDQWEHYWPERT